MNIIIPLGGKGERFVKCGYLQPKPLIQILDKCMIEYVLDNLTIAENDKVFIIYNSQLNSHNFSEFITSKYSYIHLIEINDTKGAAETLFLGIDHILKNCIHHDKCLVLDCDTFYTEDIVEIFKKSVDNTIFFRKNYDTNALYSYIDLDDTSTIINIKEKEKITDDANTGAYAFNDINLLYDYCKLVIENNITFNNEPYISCVISEMIKSKILFKGCELKADCVFSLGTPAEIDKYINNTYAFLFDLDGTLIITDDIYFDVWYEILSKYNIVLTEEIFTKFIQGNNDSYVLNTLLVNIDLPLNELSELKDNLFITNIDKLKIIDGIYDIIDQIKLKGYKLCIVTNCNKNVANKIIEYIHINRQIDFIISSDDCVNGKPNSEPYQRAIDKYNISNNKCFIFEDSKTGILSGKGVNPNILTGIETIYTRPELLSYGVDITIKNFDSFKIDKLINNEDNNNLKTLKNIIIKNTTIVDVEDVYIDDNRLKGGFIADVISFKIKSRGGEVYSRVLKYENKDENNLSIMARQLKLYEREYYFYTNISSKINIKIPKFYNLVLGSDNIINGVVLENLIDKKYKINLNLNNESIDVTLKIVDRMAKMHSKFWNNNLKSDFPELKSTDDIIFSPFMENFIEKRCELFKNKWFKILNTKQIENFNEIYINFSNIQKRFSTGNNLTFIHGDIKSPNIFYDVENDNEPYFIDWQHCAIGKGVQDLIFLIVESFDIINIKSMFIILKHYYYKKIIEYGVTNYSLDEYESDLYDAICYIPFFTCVWFGTVSQDELIDKNFPYFLISKTFYSIELIHSYT